MTKNLLLRLVRTTIARFGLSASGKDAGHEAGGGKVGAPRPSFTTSALGITQIDKTPPPGESEDRATDWRNGIHDDIYYEAQVAVPSESRRGAYLAARADAEGRLRGLLGRPS